MGAPAQAKPLPRANNMHYARANIFSSYSYGGDQTVLHLDIKNCIMNHHKFTSHCQRPQARLNSRKRSTSGNVILLAYQFIPHVIVRVSLRIRDLRRIPLGEDARDIPTSS